MRIAARFWDAARGDATIAIAMQIRERPPGPGLAKVQSPPLLQRRRVELVACAAGPLRALFDRADVLSEGSTRDEHGALVYYGSTSLLVTLPQDAPRSTTLDRALAFDPHLRLRALRVAQREAAARAGGPLGPLHAEIRVGPAPRAMAASIALTVDVTAQVLLRTARPSRA
ncbi:hypothetical protein [Sorangium cellulosum]|uniref:hypothetical protein n=1 Tax=Sorangium cellulosum TaxID=56 RepID=UPI001F5C9683|nr:hypothetical protein [Sorangium cellulosum]